MNPTEAEGTIETTPLKSKGRLHSSFGIDTAGKTYSTNFFLVLTLIVAILSIIQLSIGATYNKQCPIDQRIPTYMIVAGTVDVVVCALCLFLFVNQTFVYAIGIKRYFFFSTFRCLVSHSGTLSVLASCGICCSLVLTTVLTIFSFTWFILGCAWVFNVADVVQFTFPLKSDYCQPILYKATFAFLILTIISSVVQCCLSCFPMCRVGSK